MKTETTKSPDHNEYKYGRYTVKFLWDEWTWVVIKENGFGVYSSSSFEECEKAAKELSNE